MRIMQTVLTIALSLSCCAFLVGQKRDRGGDLSIEANAPAKEVWGHTVVCTALAIGGEGGYTYSLTVACRNDTPQGWAEGVENPIRKLNYRATNVGNFRFHAVVTDRNAADEDHDDFSILKPDNLEPTFADATCDVTISRSESLISYSKPVVFDVYHQTTKVGPFGLGFAQERLAANVDTNGNPVNWSEWLPPERNDVGIFEWTAPSIYDIKSGAGTVEDWDGLEIGQVFTSRHQQVKLTYWDCDGNALELTKTFKEVHKKKDADTVTIVLTKVE